MNPYELAHAALDKKQWSAAERGFTAILRKAPAHWQATRDLGVVRLHQGRLVEAEKLLRRSTEIHPEDTRARVQLGELFIALKRSEDAIACYEGALGVDLASRDAWQGLARALAQLDRENEAFERLSQAVDADPGRGDLQVCLGEMLAVKERHAEAIEYFVRALALEPDNQATQLKHAAALYFANRFADSLAAYRRLAVLTPHDAYVHSQIGNALFKLERLDEALAAWSLTLKLKPDSYDALVGMGATLWKKNRHAEALSFLQAALGVDPKGTVAFNNLAHVMASLKADKDAIILFDRVHELQPDSPLDANLAAATSRLRLGDYAEGWRRYENRFAADKTPVIDPAKYASARRWNGEDLNGATLLVVAEQGNGDTVQFARYMPMLAASVSGRVLFAVQSAIQPLLEQSVAQWAPAGNLALTNNTAELPPCEFYVPLMSLPLIFGTRVETIPSVTKYLSVPSSYREKWRNALPASGKLRIGIAWAGNTNHVNDLVRSMPIIELAPLLGDASVDWCVIQPGLSVHDQLSLKSVPHVFNGGAHLKDFADTAALIELLDIVVSVDTSVAHLAGALGKPVWLMLPWAAEWRWFHDRTDSPWYPTARLFRQPELGDWAGLVENVQRALIEFAKSKLVFETRLVPQLEMAM
jgi:tetratricopeptide (TPR) repeat protein